MRNKKTIEKELNRTGRKYLSAVDMVRDDAFGFISNPQLHYLPAILYGALMALEWTNGKDIGMAPHELTYPVPNTPPPVEQEES